MEEKKTTPAIKVLRHRELAQRLDALTKNIEELKSEKVLLLNELDCVDDHGISEVRQRVASMESSLEKLDQKEQKYTAELDAALAHYAELQQQSADMNAIELNAIREVIRSNKEHEAVQQLQIIYGRKFSSQTMIQSWRAVTTFLNADTEPESIRGKLSQFRQQSQQPQRHQNRLNRRER